MVGTFKKLSGSAETQARRGAMVARLLAGSWRLTPLTPNLRAEDLADVVDILLLSGAGSLAWRRIRNSDLASTAAARGLQQVFRFNALQAALQERSLKLAVSTMRRFGAEPMLVKGWAIARSYPEPGLRPYGDLDFCILPEDQAAALEAMKSIGATGCDVDLHLGFDKFYDRRAKELFDRSRLIELAEVKVRVPAEEDHLRFLCVHLLRHGAVRPVWLCDIAVALETRAAGFDWDRCLGRRNSKQADWVACVIGLAHQLLGVEVADTPAARRAHNLPRWLTPAVLRAWGTPFHFPAPLSIYLRDPLAAIKELRRHWPNPVEATAGINGRFNQLPRLPYQIAHVLSRGAAFVAELPKQINANFYGGPKAGRGTQAYGPTG